MQKNVTTKERIIEDYLKKGKNVRKRLPVNIEYDSNRPNKKEVDLRIEIKKGAFQVYNIKNEKQKRVLASTTLCVFKQLVHYSKQKKRKINLHGIRLEKNKDQSHSIKAIIT